MRKIFNIVRKKFVIVAVPRSFALLTAPTPKTDGGFFAVIGIFYNIIRGSA